MKRAAPSERSAAGGPRWTGSVRQIAAAIGVLLVICYGGVLSAPLIFDDDSTLVENRSIRSLLALGEVFSPPAESTVASRPLANFTFACSYALSGVAPWGHRLFGVVVHGFAALALLGVLRRTFRRVPSIDRSGIDADKLAGTIALLWCVHPAVTQSVTYISQRTESLMALFFLVTLYCFIRGMEGGSRIWYGLAAAACFLGALCKEVIVTAPVVILLYDRMFVSYSFRRALKSRWWAYVGITAVWPLLFWLLSDVHRRGVGFDHGVLPLNYALTQSRALVVYAQLSIWPHPLIFDRGYGLLDTVGEAWPYLVILVVLAATTLWLWVRARQWSFLPVVFFVLLSPTSSVVPVAGAPIAENRLYLPLVTIVTGVGVAFYLVWGWRVWRVVSVALVALAAVVTVARNRDYRSAESIWTVTLAQAPDNYRAHEYFGHLYSRQPGKESEAIEHYSAAQRLRPYSVPAHLHLALLLAEVPGRTGDVLAHYEAALRLQPGNAEVHYNLAWYLSGLPGRGDEAVWHYESALRLKPALAEAHNNLANLLATIPGRVAEAISHYEAALRLNPDYPDAHNNLGVILARQPGRLADALTQVQAAVRLKPDFAAAYANLGDILAGMPARLSEAITQYEKCLELSPNHSGAHHGLALMLAALPARQGDALTHFEAAVRHAPENPTYRFNLGFHLERSAKRLDEAEVYYQRALDLNPEFTAAKAALERLRANRGSVRG